MTMTPSKPKLLNELKWQPFIYGSRIAEAYKHEIYQNHDGTYTIVTPEEMMTGEATWDRIDPITAQSVLFYVHSHHHPFTAVRKFKITHQRARAPHARQKRSPVTQNFLGHSAPRGVLKHTTPSQERSI
jgi:hypothetical protein